MPYQEVWMDSEVVLEHKGVTIYRTYNDDNYDEPSIYWFTTQKAEPGDHRSPVDFDVRELRNYDAHIEHHHYRHDTGAEDYIVRVLREAIECGYICADGCLDVV